VYQLEIQYLLNCLRKCTGWKYLLVFKGEYRLKISLKMFKGVNWLEISLKLYKGVYTFKISIFTICDNSMHCFCIFEWYLNLCMLFLNAFLQFCYLYTFLYNMFLSVWFKQENTYCICDFKSCKQEHILHLWLQIK
jgi:hypothetical protein